MSEEETRLFLIGKLKEVLDYSEVLLIEFAPDPQSLRRKKKFMSSVFPVSLSHSKGVYTLIAATQLRSAVILLRSLQELWMNMRFVYSSRSDIFLWQTLIQDEGSNIKKMRELGLPVGRKEREYRRTLTYARKTYGQLPLIANVISKNRDMSRTLTLLEKCKIIDRLAGEETAIVGSMESNYRTVYSYLSETVHGTSRSLSALYTSDETSISMDIYGNYGTENFTVVLISTYLYFFNILEIYCAKVLKSQPIPEALIESARDVIALSKSRADAIPEA